MKFDDLVSAMWNQYGEIDLKPLQKLNSRLVTELVEPDDDGKYTIKFSDEELDLLEDSLDARYFGLYAKRRFIDDFTDRRNYLEEVISDAYRNLKDEDDPKIILSNLEIIERVYKVLEMEKKQWQN